MKSTTIAAIKTLFQKLLDEKELGNNQLAYIDELLTQLNHE